LQALWRTNADDSLELPKLQDFESVNLIDDRVPLKTLDYRLFAQDMFIRWVRQMTPAIRANGNTKQLITVGQDEGGLGDSPNMQFFDKEIDLYRSITGGTTTICCGIACWRRHRRS
jgi:hypothetical protein